MGLSPRLKFVLGRTLTILSWDNPVTAFFRTIKKLRHSLGRPSRSDFVHFQVSFWLILPKGLIINIIFLGDCCLRKNPKGLGALLRRNTLEIVA